jgi:hypothetical protein
MGRNFRSIDTQKTYLQISWDYPWYLLTYLFFYSLLFYVKKTDALV